VVLVKPQFEVGKARVGKGGVVRDPAAHCDAIAGVVAAAQALGLRASGLLASPITGPAGNHEYLLWLQAAGHGGCEAKPITAEEIRDRVAATLNGHP
jgi:23S rRNA (cytidine1920-2'-O)/16S rRNA (cytidine1409-2'-O)-methyltransferase